MARKKFEQVPLLTLTDLDQVRVLADPLRVRVIGLLCEKERTTKQVAEELGEKPTKLYHHVEALEKVGLIRQTRTRRNRGTLERYYLAIARSFKAEAAVFRSDETAQPDTEAMASVISTILDGTSHELMQLATLESAPEELAEEGILSFVEILTSQASITRLRRRVARLIADLQKDEDGHDETTETLRRFRMTLAFYPLDRMPDRPAS